DCFLQSFPLEISEQAFQLGDAGFVQNHAERRALVQRRRPIRHAVGTLHIAKERPTDKAKVQLGLQVFDFRPQVTSVVVFEWQVEQGLYLCHVYSLRTLPILNDRAPWTTRTLSTN